MRTLVIAAMFAFLTPLLAHAQNPPRPAPAISPEIASDGKVTFRVRAAKAQEVSLRGQWNRQPISLTKGDDGIWSVTLDTVPAGVWEYSFSVDGLNVLDSLNPIFKPQREPSKSILQIAG